MTFPFLQRHPGKRPHFTGKTQGWRGPVEWREPAHYQRQASVGIRMCGNWTCKLWIADDAARCPHCHERQAATASRPEAHTTPARTRGAPRAGAPRRPG